MTRATVNNWILRGWLPTLQVRGHRYVLRQDLATTQAQIHLREVLPACVTTGSASGSG